MGDRNLMDLVKGSGVLGLVKLASALGGYIFMIYVVRIFGKDVYGIYETGITIMLIAAMIALQGMEGAITRFTVEFDVKKQFFALRQMMQKSLRRGGIAALIIGGLLFVGAPYTAEFFNEPELIMPFRIAGLMVIPFTLVKIYASYFRGKKNMLAVGLMQPTFYTTPGIFILLLLNLTPISPEVKIVLSYLGAIFVVLGIAIYFKNRLKVSPVAGDTYEKPFGEIMSVAYPMLISSAMSLFMSWTDTLMLGYFRDMSEVGLYRVLFKTAGFLTISQFAINSMIGPMVGQFNATGDFKSFRSVLRQVGLINLGISTPLFLFVVIFPNFILGLMGDEINEGVNILRLLAVSQLLNVWSGPVLNVLNMTGKERKVRTVITTASVLNIVLNFILIPNYGYAGASVATIVSTLVWNGAGIYLVWKYYRAMTFPVIGYFTKIDD